MLADRISSIGRAASREIGAVTAGGVAAAGLWAFAKLAEETVEGDTHQWDEVVLLALRQPGDPSQPIGPAWLQLAVTDITALGGNAVLTLLLAGVAGYFFAIGRGRSALLVLGAVLSGALLSEGLKLGFARPRPELVAHLVDVRSNSFPSGHAMLSSIAYLTLGAMMARMHADGRVKALAMGYAVALTVMIGASRVYLGVHWPTDVLAGWALGAAWAAAWWLLAWRLQHTRHVEPTAPPGA